MIVGHKTRQADETADLPLPPHHEMRAGVLPGESPQVAYNVHRYMIVAALQRAGHVDYVGQSSASDREPSSGGLRDMAGRIRVPAGGVGSVVNRSRTRPTR